MAVVVMAVAVFGGGILFRTDGGVPFGRSGLGGASTAVAVVSSNGPPCVAAAVTVAVFVLVVVVVVVAVIVAVAVCLLFPSIAAKNRMRWYGGRKNELFF